jgi:hypothetical protein
MTELVYWYHFYEHRWSDDIETHILLAKCPVMRETDKTVVINYFGQEKRVLKDARKRFAYPTIELALQSYRARKNFHVSRLEFQLETARDGLAAAKEMIAGTRSMPDAVNGGEYPPHRLLPGSPEKARW